MRIKSGVDLAQIGFFVWLQAHYGEIVPASYRDIANQIAGITYGTVRLHLIALEQKGLVTIENKGTHRKVYHLNGHEFERFMNE